VSITIDFDKGTMSRLEWMASFRRASVEDTAIQKRGKSGWGYKIYTSDYLYRLGLYKMTTSAPWKNTTKACG